MLPRALVGVWYVEGATCELAFDGLFLSDHPSLRTATRWSMDRKTGREDFIGERLVIDDRELEVTLQGSNRLDLAEGAAKYHFTRDARARSSAEMRFVCSLDPCARCGTFALGEMEIHGSDDAWMYGWNCPACGWRRAYRFRSTTDAPYKVQTPRYELGEGRSQLVTLRELAVERTRLIALIEEPAPAERRYANQDLIIRAMTCTREMIKLGEADGEADFDRLMQQLIRVSS